MLRNSLDYIARACIYSLHNHVVSHTTCTAHLNCRFCKFKCKQHMMIAAHTSRQPVLKNNVATMILVRMVCLSLQCGSKHEGPHDQLKLATHDMGAIAGDMPSRVGDTAPFVSNDPPCKYPYEKRTVSQSNLQGCMTGYNKCDSCSLQYFADCRLGSALKLTSGAPGRCQACWRQRVCERPLQRWVSCHRGHAAATGWSAGPGAGAPYAPLPARCRCRCQCRCPMMMCWWQTRHHCTPLHSQ
jgi:hypothetical protein